jgi:hypothetical protein
VAHELAHTVQQGMRESGPSSDRGVWESNRSEGEAAAWSRSAAAPRSAEAPARSRPSLTPAPPGVIQRQPAPAAGAAQQHRFAHHGVSVVVRRSCAPDDFGFREVQDATEEALDRIFDSECIEESRRTRIQRNLERHGLDIRCRPSAAIGGNCAEATGFSVPANIFTLGSASFSGHPDSDPACQPLAATILHEIVHLTRGFEGEALPVSCEASCFPEVSGNPELCRDIDVFGRRREG